MNSMITCPKLKNHLIHICMTHIKTYTYSAANAGPHMVFLGGVHGDERCGTIACEHAIKLFEGGDITLQKGQVTLIPICNPRAREQGKRYTERNLNRQFYPKDNPQTYEDELINELCPILENADILVDIHSYSRGGPPFALTGPDFPPEELELALMCGAAHILDGMENSYAESNIKVDPRECHGTKEWARINGAYGLTLECGQHDAPETAEIAKKAILNCLSHLRFANIPSEIHTPSIPDTYMKLSMNKAYYMEAPGKLTKPWQQFEEVTKGTIMATYENGNTLTLEKDSIIIMPDIRDTMRPGEEWFYTGSKVL